MAKPKWDCDCWNPYPNIMHRNKNGTWKCVDRFICIRNLIEPFAGGYDKKTHCVRIREDEKNEYALSVTEKHQDVQAK